MGATKLPIFSDSVICREIVDVFHCDSISIEEGYRPIGFRFFRHILNIKAQLSCHTLTVTGEADSLDLAQAKAYSELVERSALISSFAIELPTTSNGWAAHPDPQQARINAAFEVIERDAVLSQWYTATPFLFLPICELPPHLQNWTERELSQSEYPELLVLLSTKGIGPSVSCILRNAKGFGVSGHATRMTLEESIQSALGEACRAAHLSLRREHWGAALNLKSGIPGPAGPGAHSVYYAYHSPFPAWISGSALSWTQAIALWTNQVSSIIENLEDFRFKTVLEFPIFVGFASHSAAFDLRWGSTSAEEVARSTGARRLGLKRINQETHIVS